MLPTLVISKVAVALPATPLPPGPSAPDGVGDCFRPTLDAIAIEGHERSGVGDRRRCSCMPANRDRGIVCIASMAAALAYELPSIASPCPLTVIAPPLVMNTVAIAVPPVAVPPLVASQRLGEFACARP